MEPPIYTMHVPLHEKQFLILIIYIIILDPDD